MSEYNSVREITINVLKFFSLNNKELNDIINTLGSDDKSILSDSIKYLNKLKNINSKFAEFYNLIIDILYQFDAYSKRQRGIFLRIIVIKLLELYFIYVKYYIKDYLSKDKFIELLTFLNTEVNSDSEEYKEKLMSKLFDDAIVNYLVYFLIDSKYQINNMMSMVVGSFKGFHKPETQQKSEEKRMTKETEDTYDQKLNKILGKYRVNTKRMDKSPELKENDIVSFILETRDH